MYVPSLLSRHMVAIVAGAFAGILGMENLSGMRIINVAYCLKGTDSE